MQDLDYEGLAWLSAQNINKIDLGLEDIRWALKHLNLSELLSGPLPFYCITVGGTNGKGSVVALLESCLRAARFRVGVFTSPHFVSVCERMTIDGQWVSECDLNDLVLSYRERIPEGKLSYFEWVFLLAMGYFVEQKPDVVLLEVGLGGRLDAVNAVEPDLSIITSIDYDHQQYLGDTLAAIAAEKCGIMRAGKPVVYGGVHALETVRSQAAERKSLLSTLEDIDVVFGRSATESVFRFQSSTQSSTQLSAARTVTGVMPDWVLESNVACALQALMLLSNTGPKWAKTIDPEVVSLGVKQARLKGRLDFQSYQRDFLLDVAHNPAACERLKVYLQQSQQLSKQKGRVVAVFGVMADKDYKAMLTIMSAAVDAWLLVGLEGERALPLSDLVTCVQALEGPAVFKERCLGQCEQSSGVLQWAISNTSEEDVLVVFGSFHLLGLFYSEMALLKR